MSLTTLWAIAGIVTVAVATPGPNNFIVMSAAARGGIRAAGNLIGGVVAGGLLLFGIAWAGADLLSFRLHQVIAGLGAIYLTWLGVAMIRNASRPADAPSSGVNALPATWPAVVIFQLLNAKAWVLVVTVSSVAQTVDEPWMFAVVLTIFAVISSICLIGWSLAGTMLGRTIRGRRSANGFDRAMGAVLILSAFALLYSLYENGAS